MPTYDINISALDRSDTTQLKQACVELAQDQRILRAADGSDLWLIPGSFGPSWTDQPGTELSYAGMLRFVNDQGQPRGAMKGQNRTAVNGFMVAVLRKAELRAVSGLYKLPAMVVEGSRLVLPGAGLHESGTYFYGQVPVVGSGPGTGSRLATWLSKVQFASKRDMANTYGWLLAALCRPSCHEFPLLLIDSKTKDVGKTRLARALSIVLSGRDQPQPFSGDEREIEKRVGGYVKQPGPNVILFDNVRPKRGQSSAIRSQFFSIAATAPVSYIRGNYAKASERVDFPLIILTMNMAATEHDLFDKTLRIELAGTPGTYLKVDPLTYALKHREAILTEALSLLSSIQLDADVDLRGSRFGTFARIATLATQKMGLAADYRPNRSLDSLVLELDAVLDSLAEEGKEPTMAAVGGEIMLKRDYYPELAAYFGLRRANVPAKYKGALRALLEGLPGEPLTIEGVSVRFVVRDDQIHKEVV